MHDPVINASCSHTFEKSHIEGWIASCIGAKKKPDCPLPLCNKPIANLAPNVVVKQAIDILNDPGNSKANSVEDLTTEEQELISLAADTIKAKRAADKVLGIPDRLLKPVSFPKQFLQAYRDFYKC